MHKRSPPQAFVIYGHEQWQLDALEDNESPSPEEFLSRLEDQVESGELSLDEASQYIQDFLRR